MDQAIKKQKEAFALWLSEAERKIVNRLQTFLYFEPITCCTAHKREAFFSARLLFFWGGGWV
jgi:hypothetical protein